MTASAPLYLAILAAATACWPGAVPVPAARPDAATRRASGGMPGRGAPIAVALAAATAVTVVGGAAWAASAGLVAGTLAGLVRATRRSGRERREMTVMVQALRTLVRELHAGASAPHALRTVSREIPGPVGRSLHGVADGIIAPVGSGPLERIQQRMIAGWSICLHHGIALAPLWSRLADDLQQRTDLEVRRTAEVGGAVVSGYVLAAMPALGLALGSSIGAAPLAVLGRGAVGSLLLVVGTGLCCAGLWWTASIARASR